MMRSRYAAIPVALWHIALLCFAGFPAASAVQIQNGDGTGNSIALQPPLDDPGVGNVGSRNGNSGVYLGDGWVLTAGHVLGGSMVFGGVEYAWLPTSDTLLKNPEDQGFTEFADLRMFRLATSPPLPELKVSTKAPKIGDMVVMAGNGKNREPSPTGWQVEPLGQSTIWTETTPAGTLGAENGYKYLDGNSLRWGTNSVVLDNPQGVVAFIPFQGVDTAAFATIFDNLPGTSEAQAATNDSGGGVFLSKGGSWELAGIMIAVGTSIGQPIRTSVFGNRTYSTALSVYATQINDRIVSTRVDVNEDGSVDGLDVSAVYTAWGTSPSNADFNRDGAVDGADLSLVYQFWTGDAGSSSRVSSTSLGAGGRIPDQGWQDPQEIPRILVAATATQELANVPEPATVHLMTIWGILSLFIGRAGQRGAVMVGQGSQS